MNSVSKKEPRALVFEATHREPACTPLVARGACWKEPGPVLKAFGLNATYRTRPIVVHYTLQAKRTRGTITETRRG